MKPADSSKDMKMFERVDMTFVQLSSYGESVAVEQEKKKWLHEE